MKRPQFEKEIFVNWGDDDGDAENRYMNAEETEFAAINGDGPSFVATYQLVRVRKLDKVVKELRG